jgi:hypothetical protein
MSAHSIIFVGRNTSTLRLDDLLDPTTGEPMNAATVVVDSVTTQAGVAVPGVPVPITLTYQPATSGRYEASISGEYFDAGKTYLFTFHATQAGKHFESQEVVIARQRRA